MEVKSCNELDLIIPKKIKFYPEYFMTDGLYRMVWTINTYPTETKELALLENISEKENITIHVYFKNVDSIEEKKIIDKATRRSKFNISSNDINKAVLAKENFDDCVNLISEMRNEKTSLVHTSVFIEMFAKSIDELKKLENETFMELSRIKIGVDRLVLRQKEGFLASSMLGNGNFDIAFDRVLPSNSCANLYPLCYSGKSDVAGFYIGKDKFGTNVIVDFFKTDIDKTNSNILVLGNSGVGKSYLNKLLLINLRESGKNILILDPEEEYKELTKNMGGIYIDLTSGKNIINPLEPRILDCDSSTKSVVNQHIGFLKDFFMSYKAFSNVEIDAIEILLRKLYISFGIDDNLDVLKIDSNKFPILSDLYELAEKEYLNFVDDGSSILTREILRKVCLGIHSICVGSDSKYFLGHTNISSSDFVCFGVKELLNSNVGVKNAMFFNIFSYMNNELLTKGNTVASIDELYLFLSNMTAVEYIRNATKRVRKRGSAIIMASQNIEDFLVDGIKELTKPLFSIPTHQFLFYPGNINKDEFMNTLKLDESEYRLISSPDRGSCLYRCGNEKYYLNIIVPPYKKELYS